MSESISSVVLVSCGKRKLDIAAPAKDLYISERFQEARKFAELYGEKWFVLSAKHGLITPDKILDPYDKDLDSLAPRDKQAWADNVILELSRNSLPTHHVVVLATNSYCEVLRKKLSTSNFQAIYPLRNLPQGMEERILKCANSNPTRLNHHNRFYSLLLRLQKLPGQMKPFHTLNGRQLSKAGVYFFFDKLEPTRFYQEETLRVVRIGTHGVSIGSKSLLWQRLRTHRGNDDGTGSHRSSIFRLHVGNSLLALQGKQSSSWGIGNNASKETRNSEVDLEIEVSRYLKELLVVYLPVGDAASADSDRSYIEKNAISLLTGGGAIDVQTNHWLGNFSPSQQIRESGMWNVNYVGDNYDSAFLSVLEELIARHEQGRVSQESLAPPNWRLHMLRGAIDQHELF